MIAKIADGRLLSLHGDPEHPYTNGFICRKMRFYPKRFYSQERILYPQLRCGRKGEGKFKRISWDEALRIFADKVAEVKKKYGGEAILPYQYAGNMGVINRNAGYAFFHKIGASRIKETICSAAAREAWKIHLGSTTGTPPEVAEDAEMVVAWGINVKVTNVHFWKFINRARSKGAKLVVIDPYRNVTAKAADFHIRIQPGGDAGLALGAIKALLEAKRIDIKRLNAETTGFSALESYLLGTSWESFCIQSGLTKKQIEEFAFLLERHPKIFLRIGVGLSRNSRGGESIRAILCLAAVLGLYDGGLGRGVLLFSKAFAGDDRRLRFSELAMKQTRKINMAHLGYALNVLEPAVHLFIVHNANPASVSPDAGMVRRGLEREDLFTVVHEQVMTPTARYADLLLPAATFLENRDLYLSYGHFFLGIADPVIEPVGEAVSNFDLFQALAQKMGFSERPFTQTLDERLAGYLETLDGLPSDVLSIPPSGNWIQSTRGKKSGTAGNAVSFAFQSKGADRITRIPMLGRADEFDDHDLLCRLPFKLITPPHAALLNSTFGELHQGKTGEVFIHPEDAAEYNIIDGGVVVLRNHRGETRRVARITSDTQQRLLVAEGLYWQISAEQTGINDLTSQKTTHIGAGPTFHESRVEIFPLAQR
jgi:anaerobic selenocysteine-containing dehydrogenase